MKPYEISLDHDHHIVRVVANGTLAEAIGKEIITQARKTAAEHRYSILYDVRDATTEVSLAAWWYLPRELEVLKESKTRFLKAAILIPSGDEAQKYKFYENVMQNLQLKLKIFISEEEAILWLTEGQAE